MSSFGSIAQADSLFKFDISKNNTSIGYDFKQFRKLRSADRLGPLHIKYERTISPNLGVGAATYFHAQNSDTNHENLVFPNGESLEFDQRISGFALIPKINWHFNMAKFKNPKFRKWDLYAGIGIGYGFEVKSVDYLMSVDYEGFSDYKEKEHYVATEFNLGVRYYPTKHFGAYIEYGYGASNTQLGLIFKW